MSFRPLLFRHTKETTQGRISVSESTQTFLRQDLLSLLFTEVLKAPTPVVPCPLSHSDYLTLFPT